MAWVYWGASHRVAHSYGHADRDGDHVYWGFQVPKPCPAVLIPDCVVASFNVLFREVRAIPRARSYLSYFGVRFPFASGVKIEFVFFSEWRTCSTQKIAVLRIFIIASPIKMAMFIHFGAPATPWSTFQLALPAEEAVLKRQRYEQDGMAPWKSIWVRSPATSKSNLSRADEATSIGPMWVIFVHTTVLWNGIKNQS